MDLCESSQMLGLVFVTQLLCFIDLPLLDVSLVDLAFACHQSITVVLLGLVKQGSLCFRVDVHQH